MESSRGRHGSLHNPTPQRWLVSETSHLFLRRATARHPWRNGGPWAIQVALAMPTSTELWVTLINVMCYATAVPVNLVNTPQELADEMRGCSVRFHRRPISARARARAR